MTQRPESLLDIPEYPAERVAPLADRLKQLLSTASDIVFVQAEAIVALEAAASSLARPGRIALNLVSSPYGRFFGAWLRRGGTRVVDVMAEPGQPIGLAAVTAAMQAEARIDIVAVVHAEAASGALNPLAEITAVGHARGALIVVDAVASIGGHPLDVDALGLDVVAVGPQKALAGPAGISALAVSRRAWDFMDTATAPSVLSLLDLKTQWLDRGRGGLPGTPARLELWALDAALARIEKEGLAGVIARHQRAAAASRAGLRGLGVEPWVRDDAAASTLVTAAPVPEGLQADAIISAAATFGVALGRGFGEIETRLVRLDHTGARARFGAVLENVLAYGAALQALGVEVNLGRAAACVVATYG